MPDIYHRQLYTPLPSISVLVFDSSNHLFSLSADREPTLSSSLRSYDRARLWSVSFFQPSYVHVSTLAFEHVPSDNGESEQRIETSSSRPYGYFREPRILVSIYLFLANILKEASTPLPPVILPLGSMIFQSVGLDEDRYWRLVICDHSRR